MVDAIGVEQRSPTLDAVDLVAFSEQKFGEVGTVLAGDAGNEGFFHLWQVLGLQTTRPRLSIVDGTRTSHHAAWLRKRADHLATGVHERAGKHYQRGLIKAMDVPRYEGAPGG